MDATQNIPLPEEFRNGPWINTQALMAWLGLSKAQLKSYRSRGILGYTSLLFGVPVMYNQAWIIKKLADGWICKPPKKSSRKKKDDPSKKG